MSEEKHWTERPTRQEIRYEHPVLREQRQQRAAARRTVQQARSAEVLALWRTGMTQRAIATQVGVSAGRVSAILHHQLRRLARDDKGPDGDWARDVLTRAGKWPHD